MPIKLIATDLDDTLLRDDWTLSPRSKKAIRDAQARGVKTIIATGRMALSARRYAEQLEMNIPVITYHGALIEEVLTREVLYRQVIPKTLTYQIIEPLIAQKVHCQIYLKDRVFVQKYNEWARQYSIALGVPVEEANLLEVLEGESEGVEKILLMGEIKDLSEYANFYRKHYGEKVHVTSSKRNFLEMIHGSVNKGVALKALADRYGIQREEIMAIGDSYNDIEMLKYAGLGVAMANAPDEVKQIADEVTGTNQDDGVAQAIEKWVLQ